MTTSNPELVTGESITKDQMKSHDLLDNKEINQAALKFKNGVVQAKHLTQSAKLSKKAMARVLNAVIEFPLGDEYPKFVDKQEQVLFNLTLELIDAKAMMINAVMQDTKKTAALLEQPAPTESTEMSNV